MTDSTQQSIPSSRSTGSLLWRVRLKLFGEQRNPFDPKVFHQISLIAFFAWVGMGADGLSSIAYGPEEGFHALKGFTFLTPILGLMIAATVLIISIAYTQLIEQFPTGGGGYLVASKLLHPNVGVVAGAALVIDYVLTIATSIVSGVDAVFSMLPGSSELIKTYIAIFVIIILVGMNLRGIKESIIALLPIFMVFVITHVAIVSYGLFTHVDDMPMRVTAGMKDATAAVNQFGSMQVIMVLLMAFSMGAGTLTGIEAVSNGMLALKEPRIQTGKRTMLYMALSLSFLAGLILMNYFLYNTHPVEGKTLNAVLFAQITDGWRIGKLAIGGPLVWVMLASGALILFVAAQTGFIGGPRVLANMAEDSWLPHRFSHLSERLVTRNGILLMGMAAICFIIYARGKISTLVALYAINVFVGFTLALLGMSKLWWGRRKTAGHWKRKFLICLMGFSLSALMLIVMVVMKFMKGAWLIMFVTVALVGLCFLIRRHYREVHAKVEKLDEMFADLPFGEQQVVEQPLDPGEPTAVILVEKYGGTGVHVLLNVQRLFGFRFKQYIFLSVGAIDSGRFKGVDELINLKKQIQVEADKYVILARSYGLKAQSRTSCAIDYLTEIENVCHSINKEYPNSIFFVARLLFWRDTLWSRLLHSETPLTLQRRLLFSGLQLVVLPVRLQ